MVICIYLCVLIHRGSRKERRGRDLGFDGWMDGWAVELKEVAFREFRNGRGVREGRDLDLFYFFCRAPDDTNKVRDMVDGPLYFVYRIFFMCQLLSV